MIRIPRLLGAQSTSGRYRLLCNARRKKGRCMQTAGIIAFGSEGLELERAEVRHHRVILFICITAAGARCPVRGLLSSRIHSRYTRAVADLPWHSVPVILCLRIRRFLCEQNRCGRAIFADRILEVAAYARKTDRLENALALVGFALGGETEARLAGELGLITDPNYTLEVPSPCCLSGCW